MDEPVYYCNHCLSLYILDNNGEDVCGNCGSVNYTSHVPFDKYQEIIEKNSDVRA